MLSHYTNKDLVILNPEIKSKKELFEKMVNHLYNFDYIIHKKDFLQALLDREEVANTELMPGVALPHSRSETVEKLFLSIVIHREGIDYENEEMGKAKIIFFFGTSVKFNKEYLQLLAKSARLLKNEDFREKLLQTTSPAKVISLLDEFDRDEDSASESKTSYLMLITLHNSQRLNDVLSSLIELGITNASVIKVESLSNKISLDLPIFSSLYYDDKKRQKNSILITCQINDLKISHQLNELLVANGIDFNSKGTGFIQIVESEFILGKAPIR